MKNRKAYMLQTNPDGSQKLLPLQELPMKEGMQILFDDEGRKTFVYIDGVTIELGPFYLPEEDET